GGTGSSSSFVFSNLPAAGQSLIFDEQALRGWDFTSVSVSGDSGSSTSGDVATLGVNPGENITVTYTNTKQATVTVVKNTIGGNRSEERRVGNDRGGQGSPGHSNTLSITDSGRTVNART